MAHRLQSGGVPDVEPALESAREGDYFIMTLQKSSPQLLIPSLSLSLSLAVIGTCFARISWAQHSCSKIHAEKSLTSEDKISQILGKGVYLTPRGAESRLPTAKDHVMFGFESEYTPSQLDGIVAHYRIKNIPKAKWNQMVAANQVQHVQNILSNMSLGNKSVGLVKNTDDPALDFLPQELIRDDTGNVEIILDPVNDFMTWKNQVQAVNRLFGTGSQQGMISFKKSDLFRATATTATQATAEVLGLYNFIHQVDALSRMHKGAQIYAKDPTKSVLRPFAHPYLAPMTRTKQQAMGIILRSLAEGRSVYFNAVTAESPKFVGSTTPRPDIGASLERIGSEVRDTHNNEAELISKVARASLLGLGHQGKLIAFKDVVAPDTKADFEKLPKEVQAMLKVLFPARMDQTFGGPEQVFALEVFRNFSHPLKMWDADLAALGRMDLKHQVAEAQRIFILRLTQIAADFNSKSITSEQASVAVQGATASFSKDSGLYEAYKNFEDKFISEIDLK
ncbi:MAG: hypothetical protein ACK5P6_00420 [Pseudobdellovibrionaceae bacterium]